MNQHASVHMPELERRRRLKRAMALLSAVVVCGSIGFAIIEGWDFWRAFFFTLVTITTVGYGDEGISEAGKKFAALLLVGGIGTSSYAFALLVQTAVTNQFAWKKRMHSQIAKLSHHTIVCGFGRMGRAVCKQLSAAGVALVVIDADTDAFHQACDEGFLAVEGSSSDDEILKLAGISAAGTLVSTISNDAQNVFTALSARQFRPDLPILARAAGDEEARKLVLAGATRVVSPYQSGGQQIADLILRPGVADFIARSQTQDGGLVMSEIVITEDSELCEGTLADYGRGRGSKIAFVALQREGEQLCISPPGSSRLTPGDRLIVAGDPDQVELMLRSARTEPAPALPRAHAHTPVPATTD